MKVNGLNDAINHFSEEGCLDEFTKFIKRKRMFGQKPAGCDAADAAEAMLDMARYRIGGL